MDKIEFFNQEKTKSVGSFAAVKKYIMMGLETLIFFEVFAYNLTTLFFNKTKSFYDTITALPQITKQKIIENKKTVIVFGKKMELQDTWR